MSTEHVHAFDAEGRCPSLVKMDGAGYFWDAEPGEAWATPCEFVACGICRRMFDSPVRSPGTGRNQFMDGDRYVHLSCFVFELGDRVVALESRAR